MGIAMIGLVLQRAKVERFRFGQIFLFQCTVTEPAEYLRIVGSTPQSLFKHYMRILRLSGFKIHICKLQRECGNIRLQFYCLLEGFDCFVEPLEFLE